MVDLPDSMYDYRHNDNVREYVGDCYVCGQAIFRGDNYRYKNDALMHDDGCFDEYINEDEYEEE